MVQLQAPLNIHGRNKLQCKFIFFNKLRIIQSDSTYRNGIKMGLLSRQLIISLSAATPLWC